MADKYLNKTGLAYFFEKLKGIFVRQEAGKSLTTNDFTNADKTKLDGIETGAEVNQNAFGIVSVNGTQVSASSEADSLSLIAGENIEITPDATNKRVTIGASGIDYDPFTGASGIQAGTEGLVPAPAAGEQNAVLLGRGSFSNLEMEIQEDLDILTDESTYYLAIITETGQTVCRGEIGELFQTGHFGICSTTATNPDKTLTPHGWNLQNGAFIFVQFANTNEAALADLTLEISATGPYPIRKNGQVLTEQLQAGYYYLFVFHNNQYQLIADSSGSGGGGGTTYETMTQAEAAEGVSTTPRVITAKVLHDTIPDSTSDLTNDSGFITSAAVPTKTSQLTNDSGFITSAAVPTKTSQLTNDSGFITASEAPVTGVKGNSESTYRTGNVNITKANIGLGNVENKSAQTIVDDFRTANPSLSWGIGSNTTGTGNPRAELRRLGSGSNYQVGLVGVNSSGTSSLYPLILADGSRNFALIADFTPKDIYNSGGVRIRKTGKLIECVFNAVSTLPTKATIDSAAGGETWLPAGTTTRFMPVWEYSSKQLAYLTINTSGFAAVRTISASTISSYSLYATMMWYTS